MQFLFRQKKPLIIHIISSLHLGGAEQVLVDIIEGLPEYRHYVVYIHDGQIRSRLQQIGISCVALRGLWSSYDPIALFFIYRLIKKAKPNLICTSLWQANLIGRIITWFTNVPVVNILHSTCFHQGTLRTMLDWVVGCYQRVHCIAVSYSIKQSFNWCWWVRPYSYTVIQNGFAFNKVVVSSEHYTKKLLNIPEINFVVGAVGRFVEVKNFGFLIQVMGVVQQYYPAITLVLVGYGPQHKALQEMADYANIDVRILAGVQARGIYSLFNCLVQPSLTEGLSLVLLEALAAGLPVIVHAPSCMHEVVQHKKEGIVLPYLNKVDFSNAITYLYRNPGICQRMSEKARLRVKNNFNYEQMVKLYKQLFFRIMRL